MQIRTFSLLFFTLTHDTAYANSSGKAIYSAFVNAVMIGPYWLLALIPFLIQWRNRGRGFFFSILTYTLCIGGMTLAKYDWYGSAMPDLYFNEEERLFLWMILPFVIVMILAINKDYTYWKNKNI